MVSRAACKRSRAPGLLLAPLVDGILDIATTCRSPGKPETCQMVCGRFPFVKRTAVMVVGNGGVESGCRCMTRKAGRWPLAPSATNTCLMPWEALVDHVGPILGKSATAHAAFCKDHF